MIRPKLSELQQQILNDAAGRLGVKLSPRGVIAAITNAQAAALHSFYGRTEYLTKQNNVKTATGDHLATLAELYGLKRKPPSIARGMVSFNGDEGTSIPAGTALAYEGAEFRTLKTVDINQYRSSGLLGVEATRPGPAGNVPSGRILDLVSPLRGVEHATSLFGFAGGADVEDDEAFRARILSVINEPARGGTPLDYVAWALQVPGVTRAWCVPFFKGVGSVGLTFVTDNETARIIPDDLKVAEVQKYIEDRRPVCAAVSVFSPLIKTLNFTLKITPDTPELRAAVQKALRAFINLNGTPGAVVYYSKMSEAITQVGGLRSHLISSPGVADITTAVGEFLQLGAITWT